MQDPPCQFKKPLRSIIIIMGLSLNSLYEQGHYPTTLVHVNCCTDEHTCDEQNFLLYTELYVTLSYDDFIFIVLMLDKQ